MAFYLYNELATMTIKKTGAVTASVANTAKRVIVLVFMSAVTGKALTTEQKIGAAIAIAFVMLYSVIDDLVKKFKEKSALARGAAAHEAPPWARPRTRPVATRTPT